VAVSRVLECLRGDLRRRTRPANRAPARARSSWAPAIPDLLTALRQSIERSRAAAKGEGAERLPPGTAIGVAPAATTTLLRFSKAELDKRVKKAGIEGRSKMTKTELARALQRAA
jgi:hypothetical protein